MHDALIVLGYSNDESDPVFRARMDKAIELYHQGLAAQLILSGCCSDKLDIKPNITEASSMQAYAIEHDVPGPVILLEEESVDTLGNFYFCKKLFLEPCSWYHIGFVSTPWHTYRANYLAAAVLGPSFEVTGYESEQPDGWSTKQIERSEGYNKEQLAIAEQQLGSYSPGDHNAMHHLLGNKPKGSK